MYYKIVFILIFLAGFLSTNVHSQPPELGAQVWIEPGHTDEEIDTWFKILAEHEMPVARLFIMWNYIEYEQGVWDFTLYDKAFDAAEKYGVKIVATLTTNRRPPHRGDFYQLHATDLPKTEEELNGSKLYIEKIVNHWKDHSALDTWILTNEASQYNAPAYPLAIEKYREWLKVRYNNIQELNKIWFTDFNNFDEIEYSEKWTEIGYWNWQILHMNWNEFWRDHLTWWLSWIRDEVRKHDINTPIQVHSENVTGNLARKAYDFPAWRPLGNTLGTSAHVAWAFGIFERDQFALGMSYVSDLFAGSSAELPYWITELQGGTNLYSGHHPMTPTPEDISQWVWTSIGSGADRVIFWLLNNRLKAFETTEWSMLDFNHNPTEALIEAGKVAKTINANASFFENAVPIRSPIIILLSNESMTSELFSRRTDYLGRGEEAHIFSAYGYYEAFSELGVPVQIKFMHDFDWDSDQKGRIAILPHTTVISEDQQKGMENFVEMGNTLLMSGLSGLMNDKTEAWVFKDFPFSRFLGADFKNYSLVSDLFQLDLEKPALSLPAHLWRGEIENHSADVIGRYNDKITAVENRYGEGKAIWIPSLLGLGAWMADNEPLARFVSQLAESQIAELPFKFSGQQKSCVLRVLEHNGQFVTIVTNGAQESNSCSIDRPENLEPEVLWGDDNQLVDNAINLGGLETAVILWQ